MINANRARGFYRLLQLANCDNCCPRSDLELSHHRQRPLLFAFHLFHLSLCPRRMRPPR